MKNLQWTTIDKSKWPAGEWNGEPDKMQFVDEATGLPCLIVRSPSGGHLCGYVGVPSSHPWHGKEYDNYDLIRPDVHGGLTFSEHCTPSADEGRGICHIVEDGEDDKVWWFGFDCAHLGDISPGYISMRGNDPMSSYKSIRYVELEVAALARQCADAAKPQPATK